MLKIILVYKITLLRNANNVLQILITVSLLDALCIFQRNL